ncbi:MAG: FHA domain-containing protein [Myxococcota bacterium]|nr:FHA domain-containing protein [Myxococcota bacterium]
MYKLVISDDEGKTTVVPLIRDEVTIGRKEGNTIRLTDRNVSRFHARVIREDDVFRIEDMDSLCGTKVNTKLLKSESEIIAPGDKISIGDYSLSIRTDVSADVPLGRQMEPGDESGIGKVTPHARLVVLTHPTPGRDIDLTADLYVIGRSQEANCRIKDESISRAHARIDLVAGEWTISDLDSVNGILINGQKKDDYVLRAGDVVELGNVRLRYVAPGEPYEFDYTAHPHSLQPRVPPAPAKSNRFLYLLGALGVISVVAIALAILLMGNGDENKREPLAAANKSIEDLEGFDALMERGKDAMQSEDWAEAARLFALALQRKPSNRSARELKDVSVKESDAQKAFTSGLEASEQGQWKKAVAFYKEIPRSSHYYHVEELRKASENLCDQLAKRAMAAMGKENFVEASGLAEEIENIPIVPEKCKQTLQSLQVALIDKVPDQEEAYEVTDNREEKKPSQPRRQKQKEVEPVKQPVKHVSQPASGRVVNPYANEPTRTSPVQTAIGQAHTAIRDGDHQGAIAILEKAGNGRRVLKLLSRLYMKVGNRSGYERVARLFIQLYPNDPQAEHFARALQK